jgi:4-hydroxy-2-oxoheptanedioate aldolase
MISNNFLKNKLNNGDTVIGTWCIIPSAVNAEIISLTGVDFIIIDNEHGSISFETATSMIMACELNKVSPIYRPPNVNQGDITKALDLGFHGIQVPNITSRQQLDEILKYAKFPPSGNRGFSPFVRSAGYTNLNSENYFNTANSNTLVAINIEGIDAIENVEQFLDVEELDIIFLGAFDISKVLGTPGNMNNPELLSQMEHLTKLIRQAGKHAGTITTSKEKITQYIEFGMDYIVHMVDCEMLRLAYLEVVTHFKKNIR